MRQNSTTHNPYDLDEPQMPDSGSFDERRRSTAILSSTQQLVPMLNLDGAFSRQRGSRQAQVSKVYGQNLTKMADAKRKLHSKAFEEHLKHLPPGKNFIKENARKLSVQGSTNEIKKKLDRLKKLQEQAGKLRAQTTAGINPMFQVPNQDLDPLQLSQLQSAHRDLSRQHVLASSQEINFNMDADNFLHNSIELVLKEKDSID